MEDIPQHQRFSASSLIMDRQQCESQGYAERFLRLKGCFSISEGTFNAAVGCEWQQMNQSDNNGKSYDNKTGRFNMILPETIYRCNDAPSQYGHISGDEFETVYEDLMRDVSFLVR